MRLRSGIQWGLAGAIWLMVGSSALSSTPELSEPEETATETPPAEAVEIETPEIIVDDFAVEGARSESLPVIEELTPEQIGEGFDNDEQSTPGDEGAAPADEPVILLDPEFVPAAESDLGDLLSTEDNEIGDIDISLPKIDDSILLEFTDETSEENTPEAGVIDNTETDDGNAEVAAPSLAPDATIDEEEAGTENEIESDLSDDVIETDESAADTEETQQLSIEDGRASPPMWRLVDEDSEIWLLGTFHILPPGLDWRSDPLAKAIDAADTIYFEAEVDTPDAQQKTIQTLMTEGFLPKEKTLSSLLEEAEAQKLQKIAGQIGLPFAAIDTMRPWQAFLTTTVQYIVSKGFDPGSGVETILLKEARLRDRNLQFFETVEEQLSLFTSLKPEVELALLKLTLEDWDKQDEQFSALFTAWRNGDAEEIDTLMNETMREQSPEVYEALIVRRNEAWAGRIKDVMAGEGRVLIAVGAGHLVGDNSVPALLNAQGFEVTRYGLEQ